MYQSWFDMTFPVWRKQPLVEYLKQHNDKIQGWNEDGWSWNFLGNFHQNFTFYICFLTNIELII